MKPLHELATSCILHGKMIKIGKISVITSSKWIVAEKGGRQL